MKISELTKRSLLYFKDNMNRKMLTMLHVYVQTALKNQNRNLIEQWVINNKKRQCSGSHYTKL